MNEIVKNIHAKLLTHKANNDKAELYIELAELYEKINIDKEITFYEKAFSLLDDRFASKKCHLILKLVSLYHQQGNHRKCEAVLKKRNRYIQKKASNKQLSNFYRQYGFVLNLLNKDLKVSLEFHNNAIDFAIQSKDEATIIAAKHGLCTYYFLTDDKENIEEKTLDFLKFAKEKNNYLFQSITLNNLAQVYHRKNRFIDSIESLEKNIEILNTHVNLEYQSYQRKSILFENLGNLLAIIELYDLAIVCYDISLKYSLYCQDKHGIVSHKYATFICKLEQIEYGYTSYNLEDFDKINGKHFEVLDKYIEAKQEFIKRNISRAREIMDSLINEKDKINSYDVEVSLAYFNVVCFAEISPNDKRWENLLREADILNEVKLVHSKYKMKTYTFLSKKVMKTNPILSRKFIEKSNTVKQMFFNSNIIEVCKEKALRIISNAEISNSGDKFVAIWNIKHENALKRLHTLVTRYNLIESINEGCWLESFINVRPPSEDKLIIWRNNISDVIYLLHRLVSFRGGIYLNRDFLISNKWENISARFRFSKSKNSKKISSANSLSAAAYRKEYRLGINSEPNIDPNCSEINNLLKEYF